MKIFNLIFKEIFFRKLNFVLGLLAIVMAVALLVAYFTTSQGSRRETIRLTRDMGFNLRVVPKETDMTKFWNKGYSDETMPEGYVTRFMDFKDFSYAHLTATLYKRITWHNKEVILTGISVELEPSGRKKSSMIFSIAPGDVYLGYEIANAAGIKKGEDVDILGKTFRVTKTLAESGSIDDIRIYLQLKEAQALVGLEGLINEIKALNCLCLVSDDDDPLEILRNQLEQVLPEAKVTMNKTIAIAREKQRLMFENYFAFILPLVIIVCAIWIGTLAMINVKERKQEIGLLRALGFETSRITFLFLGKAVVLGIVGAVLGFILGTAISLEFGPDIFKVTAKAIKPLYFLLVWFVIGAPAFAAISAFIPAMVAISQDPALTLREE